MTAPSFRRWLRQFGNDESAIGDLARDARADPDWLEGPGSLARYEAHLEELGTSPAVQVALRTAWQRYQLERAAGPAPRIVVGSGRST